MSGIGAWYRQFNNEYEYFNEVSAPISILVSVSVHPYKKPNIFFPNPGCSTLTATQHGRIKKPWAPGPGHVKAPPFAKINKLCTRKTRTHTQTPLGVYIYFTNNVLDLTVELDTLAIVLGQS